MSETSGTPSDAVGEISVHTETVEARAEYQHPLPVRFCHWLNTISLFVLAGSGLQIFMAFPSFGPKLPEKDLISLPERIGLGGWLGGGLQWHLTFAWIYVITGVVYLAYEFFSGNIRQILFVPRDLTGVWPMVRYYFFFGRKPRETETYNPLQKLAYTSAILLAVVSVMTGMVLFNPVQFSLLAGLMAGFHWARLWHFGVLCALLLFVLGHLVMVALHGWNNFMSMLSGWKRDSNRSS